MTTTLSSNDQALLSEYGSTVPAFIEAVKLERRGTDAIDKAIVSVLINPHMTPFEAFDIVHALKTLNRRNR